MAIEPIQSEIGRSRIKFLHSFYAENAPHAIKDEGKVVRE